MKAQAQMLHTGFALVPGFLTACFVFGPGIGLNVLVALLTALVLELGFYRLQNKPPSSTEVSAGLLAGALLALCLPPYLPFTYVVLGVSFGLIFGKYVYGGLGQNLFNPAMVGYAALIVSAPLLMSQWYLDQPLGLSPMDLLAVKAGILEIDGYSGATALDLLRNRQGMTMAEYWVIAAHRFEPQALISAGYLLGGLYLLKCNIIRWQLPVAMLIGLLVPAALLFDGGSSDSFGSPLLHLLSGATLIGAFFIITDPVSSPNTRNGLILYGLTIGALTFLIRAFGSFPDGLAFAVLLANALGPLLDLIFSPSNRTRAPV